MRILVTGARGFLGRAFRQTALARGHRVLGLRRHDPGTFDCEAAIGSLEFPPWEAIERFRPEAALHLAWIATPGLYLESAENELLACQSQSFFLGLAERGVGYLAGAGSCVEYAASNEPLREDAELSAMYPYARAKANLGRWLVDWGASSGVRCSWFRIFYPYGPGEHPNRLPTLVVRTLANGAPMELRTPDSVKDYIYVSDVAAALCQSMEKGLTGPVNIGSGTGISLTAFAHEVADALHADPSLVRRAEPVALDPWPIQIADVSRLRALGWKPEIDVRTGVRLLIEDCMRVQH